MLIAGLMFLILNFAVFAPLATGGVQDAVDEKFSTYTKDVACANDDCTEANDDWAVSTTQRDYSAWSITNAADIMATGADPAYEEVGPFTYDITSTRTITGHDATNGTLTYNQVKSFECAAESVMPCDTMVTQINIGFQPQVIGATGMAIGGIMDSTKDGFASGAIGKEMESFSAGKATGDGIINSYGGIQLGFMTGGTTVDAANASMMLGVGWYDAYDAYFASINGSGLGDTVTYTMAIQGLQAAEAAGGVNTAGVTFTGNQSIGDLSYAFESAMMPTGEDASLTNMQGVMILAGHCNAYATGNYSVVSADLANSPAFTTGTMQRASIWGYASADINATIATDYAICYGVAGTFANIHGGADDNWYEDPMAVNASTRLMNYLGVEIDNTVAMGLLFGGQGTATPTGILATNAIDENDSPTAFGIAAFDDMDSDTAMATYGLDATQYDTVATWVDGWLTSASSLPMVLLGGTGTMTAEDFVNVSFGAADPINGGYLTNSLNLGGGWGLVGASFGAPAVDLTAAQSGNLLYGPLGLTTSAGAAIFLFGELSGQTPPIDFATMQAGPQMEWNASTIAALYGIDVNAASAVRALMMGPIYGETTESFVPGYLMSTFGTTPYLTQPVSSWLHGWHDPVSAYLASGNPYDMTVGWASLETNETYYGSDGVLNGDGTSYTICTGEVSTCDKGESVLEDGSNELPWHNTEMAIATYGLIGVEYLDGATGGFLTGDGDKVDVSGYAVVGVTCDDTGTVEGIPVDICTASVDATTRSIQAKNLKTFTLLDATPSALPIFLGSDITLKSEQLSGLIIAGESTTTFYLDTRQNTNMTTAPLMSDLTKVFQIKSSSTIGADDADTMESSIVTNQETFGYWTNFDHPVDYLTVLFYLGAVLCIGNGLRLMMGAEEESAADLTQAEKHDEAPVEITSESTE